MPAGHPGQVGVAGDEEEAGGKEQQQEEQGGQGGGQGHQGETCSGVYSLQSGTPQTSFDSLFTFLFDGCFDSCSISFFYSDSLLPL